MHALNTQLLRPAPTSSCSSARLFSVATPPQKLTKRDTVANPALASTATSGVIPSSGRMLSAPISSARDATSPPRARSLR